MGDATRDLIWVIGIFIALGVLWVLAGGPSRATNADHPFIKSPLDQSFSQSAVTDNSYSNGNVTQPTNPTHSPYYKQVTLSLGDAPSEIQANNEYVVLYSNAPKPVTITGWKLVTNKQKVVYQSADITIPGGVTLYDPRVARIPQPIVLAPNDQAYIITGTMAVATSPYKIDTSFKTNICSGYIGAYPNYRFVPNLYSSCPVPTSVATYDTIDDDCTKFIESLGACHTPEFRYAQDSSGQFQPGYVDYTPNLSSQCKSFLQVHYNYNACIDAHRYDPQFSGNTWYVYLNRQYEQWGERRETISLYDQNNLLVDQISY